MAKKVLLIGLSGFAGVGKDEVRRILCEHHGFVGLAFADKLRDMALHLDPYFPEVEENYASLIKRLGYDAAKRQNPCIRQFLIKLGHGARLILGGEVWLNAALPVTFEPKQSIVISDVRYPNEAKRIKELGGYVIRITRPGVEAVDKTEADSLAITPSDYVLANDGTLGELWQKVAKCLSLLS